MTNCSLHLPPSYRSEFWEMQAINIPSRSNLKQKLGWLFYMWMNHVVIINLLRLYCIEYNTCICVADLWGHQGQHWTSLQPTRLPWVSIGRLFSEPDYRGSALDVSSANRTTVGQLWRSLQRTEVVWVILRWCQRNITHASPVRWRDVQTSWNGHRAHNKEAPPEVSLPIMRQADSWTSMTDSKIGRY